MFFGKNSVTLSCYIRFMCLIFYASCTVLICTIKIIYWFNFCTNQRESNWGYFWRRCIFVFCLASLSLYKESSWPLLWMWSVCGAFLRRSRITLRAIQTLDPDSDTAISVEGWQHSTAVITMSRIISKQDG